MRAEPEIAQLLLQIQLQALVRDIAPETALDYALINLERHTGNITHEDYEQGICLLTAAAIATEEQCYRYLEFAQLVMTLTTEYCLNCWLYHSRKT